MTRGSQLLIIPPIEELGSALHKKKDKNVDESSSSFHLDKFEIFEKTPNKKGTGYEPGTESDLEEEVKSKLEEMVDLVEMMMEEYKRRLHNDNGPGLVPPTIPAATNFELEGQILAMLTYIPFHRKDYEDAFKHIGEGLDIANYFNVPNVSRDVMLLRMLLVTFTRDAKLW